MFDYRWLVNNDYEELKKWWIDWGWTPPTKAMLPDYGVRGIMISKGDVNICAGFVYYTNSTIAWIEFIISNKEYREDDRKLALKELINALTEIIKSQGHTVIFTSLKNKNLMSHFTECGFIVGDEGVTQLIKKV